MTVVLWCVNLVNVFILSNNGYLDCFFLAIMNSVANEHPYTFHDIHVEAFLFDTYLGVELQGCRVCLHSTFVGNFKSFQKWMCQYIFLLVAVSIPIVPHSCCNFVLSILYILLIFLSI